MFIKNDLMKIIENEIIKACENEVKPGNCKELLGLEIQYFYDGEFADIGCKIVIFNIKEDEGYSIYKSFVLDYEEIKESLLNIIHNEDKSNKYNIICDISKEIKEHIESIKWNEIVQTAEEFYIDLINYD